MKIQAVSLVVLFSLVAATGVWAQNSGSVPALKPFDASIYLSGQSANSPNNGLPDARELAPESQILARDYTGYNTYDQTTMSFGGADFMLGLRLRNKEKTGYRENSFLRIGLGYSSGSSFNAGLYRHDRSPYDTLTSSQTGNEIYVDSVTHRNLNVNHYADYLRLDVAYIFRTGGDSHWSLFGGIGARGMVGFNGRTSVQYHVSKGTEQQRQGQDGYFDYYRDFDNDTFEEETFVGGTSFGGALYLPLGIDVRFGKTNDFWKRIHLFTEFRPGMEFVQSSKFDFAARPFIQYGLGVRVTI